MALYHTSVKVSIDTFFKKDKSSKAVLPCRSIIPRKALCVKGLGRIFRYCRRGVRRFHQKTLPQTPHILSEKLILTASPYKASGARGPDGITPHNLYAPYPTRAGSVTLKIRAVKSNRLHLKAPEFYVNPGAFSLLSFCAAV